MTKKISITYSTYNKPNFSRISALTHIHQTLVQTHAHGISYNNSYTFLQVPFDTDYYKIILQTAADKRSNNYSAIVFIGIGGSQLGFQAVHQALLAASHPPQLYYADTLDPQETSETISTIENYLKNNQNILLILVSKSGTTLESIAHFRVYSALLQKYCPQTYHEHIVIITDSHSLCAHEAHQKNYTLLTIPKPIGGRYSLFTAVGIFALALVGADTDKLLDGARAAVNDICTQTLDNNTAAQTAVYFYEQYQRGIIILDYFIFSKKLSKIGSWYRQLIGESLGKQNIQGKDQHMVPTVSIGSNDLHAVAQLYLGGNPPLCTQFLTCATYPCDVIVPTSTNNSRYSTLMNELFQATVRAYDEQQRPYVHIDIPMCSAYYIGYLLQFHMIQTIYLATLLAVDPFDQPHVELYKKHVRSLLQ